MTANNGAYRLILGSDPGPDNKHLDLADAAGTIIARVLYTGAADKMVIMFGRHVLPLEAVERLLSTAKARLPPADQGTASCRLQMAKMHTFAVTVP